jgi:hypothetical protein
MAVARASDWFEENGYRLVIAKVRDLRVDDHGSPRARPGGECPQELPADDALVVVRHDQTARGSIRSRISPRRRSSPGPCRTPSPPGPRERPAGAGDHARLHGRDSGRSSTRGADAGSDSAAHPARRPRRTPPHPRSWAGTERGRLAAFAAPPRWTVSPGADHGNGASRDPIHVAPDETIEHDVADHEDPVSLESSDELGGAAGLHQAEPFRGGLASSTSITGIPSRTG